MNIAELKREAESGSVVSQSVLGICYLYGRDVEVNHQEAFRLLSSAAERGASRAVVNLARMFAEGLGTPKNLPEAIRLYRTGGPPFLAERTRMRVPHSLRNFCCEAKGGIRILHPCRKGCAEFTWRGFSLHHL